MMLTWANSQGVGFMIDRERLLATMGGALSGIVGAFSSWDCCWVVILLT